MLFMLAMIFHLDWRMGSRALGSDDRSRCNVFEHVVAV